jgi:hypothetical protein
MASTEPKRVQIGIWMRTEDARKLYAAADELRIPITSLVRSVLYGYTKNLTDFTDLPPDPVTYRRRFVEE